MDLDRFDALARAFAANRSRRRAIGMLVGGALLSRGGAAFAASSKAKGKGHDKDRGQGHETGNGQGHEFDKLCRDLPCEKVPIPEGGDPEFCCKGGFCSCGGDCCAEELCFQTGIVEDPNKVFCCTGPKLVICLVPSGEPGVLRATCCKDSCDTCDAPGPAGIAGSYRRPNR